MNSKWKTVPLGDFVSIQRGHDLPSDSRNDGSVPVMGSSGLSGWHDEVKCPGPGVTIGRSGASIGVVSYQKDDFWPLNTALYVTDFHGNDERFVYFALSVLNLERFNSGTAQPSLNRNFISHVEVPCPPLDAQRRIAGILGGFEDKISLNSKINDTLESVARSIFRARFLKFDRKDNSDQSRLDDYSYSGKSTIDGNSKGWKRGTLGDLMTKVTDGVDPDEKPESTPYIGLSDMPEGSVSLEEWGNAGEVSSRKYEFEKWDILFGRLRPVFCKVGFAPVDGISSTDIQIIRPERSPNWREFLLCHLSEPSFIRYCDKLATGTRMPRISWDDMCDYPVMIPPVSIVEEFHSEVEPIFEKILNNIHESLLLEEIKTTLHPMLVKGELLPQDMR